MRKILPPLELVILLAFGILSFIGILHHEMWLDEINGWLTAKDSPTPWALFHNTGYTGHPMLWDVFVFIITCFTHNPFALQVFSVLISCSAAFLVLKYAPFPTLYKAGIVFSYFFLFEYNVISRGYNLTWLLLVVFCILFVKEKRNYLFLTIILSLMANVHLFSFLLTLPLFGIIFWLSKKEKKQFLIPSIVFIIGITASILTLIPSIDSGIVQHSTENLFSLDRISKTSSFFVKGLYPLPDVYSYYFWNSNFIVKNFKLLGILLTPLLFILPYIFCYNKPLPLIFFYASSLFIMLALFILKLFTGIHYMGYAFMILLATFWLATDGRLAGNTKYSLLDKLRTYTCKPFIWSILLCQVSAVAYALRIDYLEPFSESKNVAKYISSTVPPHSLLISVPFPSATTIAGNVNDSVYCPELGWFITFWNQAPKENLSIPDIFARIKQVINNSPSPSIVITVGLDWQGLIPIRDSIENNFNKNGYALRPPKDFSNAIVRGENYRVFIITRK